MWPDEVAALELKRVLADLLGSGIREIQRAGGQHGVSHYRVVLRDGRTAFVKAAAPPGGSPAWPGEQDRPAAGSVFAAEARGMRWLRAARAVRVPEVLACADWALAIEWLPQQPPSRQAAERFGQELAALHLAGADSFGAAWPGYIAGLPLGETCSGTWPQWYAEQRLLPFARLASSRGALGHADVALVEAAADQTATLAGPPEPPSRIHGDCWAGNVLWSGGRCALIDPAAQGGHRESDLAMLALFGAPFLDQVLAAYQEAAPLAAGWRDRVPLHQLHPLLVHACLFGSAYREPVLQAARSVLATAKRTGPPAG